MAVRHVAIDTPSSYNLSGEIGWTGVNSRIVSAKKPRLDARGVQRLTIEER